MWTQNWSLVINCAGEDLLLMGSKAEEPWPAQRGDSETRQQARRTGHCAVNLCLTAYGHPAQLGSCPSMHATGFILYIYIFYKAFLSIKD